MATTSLEEIIAASLSLQPEPQGCEGYDTLFGSVRNVAVKGERRMEGSMGASEMEMQYKVCQSLEEVRCMLQIEQSSILGLFGAPGNQHISNKLRFFNSLNLTTHSLAVILYAKVVSGGYTVTDASLTVAAPRSQAEVEGFVRLYGDSYVSKVVMGAEYYACFTYAATTRDEKMDLLAKMKKDGVFSWDSSSSFGGPKIAKFNSANNLLMEFCQSLRGISGVALPKPTHLVDFVLKLPTLTVNNPLTLHFECTRYEHAKGFLISLHFPNLMRKRAIIVEDSTFLHLLYKVKGLETDVQHIEAKLQEYGLFIGSARAFMDDVKRDLETDRAAMRAVMHNYEDFENCSQLLKLWSLNHEDRLHNSRWTEVPSIYLGGSGGTPYGYVTNIAKFIRSSCRIVSIQLCSGQWIDKITIKYNNGDVFECGGWGGSRSNVLYVSEGERFSKIRIKDNGKHITYLEFVLSNGSSLAGGDVSSAEGQDVTYEPYKEPDYHYFCGFQVRSGMYVDGLRAIFAKFLL